MIKKIASLLLDSCLKAEGGEVTDERREIFQHGLEVSVFAVVNIVSIILAGILLQNILASIVFLLAFSPLRLFCGGYHTKSYLTCNTLFILVFVLVYFAAKYSSPHISNEIISIVILLSLIPIYAYAPVGNSNKNDYDDLTKKRYNRISVAIFVVIALSTLFLAVISAFCAMISALALLTVSIFVLTEKFKKGGLKQ
jgi:accessory gene regulator B